MGFPFHVRRLFSSLASFLPWLLSWHGFFFCFYFCWCRTWRVLHAIESSLCVYICVCVWVWHIGSLHRWCSLPHRNSNQKDLSIKLNFFAHINTNKNHLRSPPLQFKNSHCFFRAGIYTSSVNRNWETLNEEKNTQKKRNTWNIGGKKSADASAPPPLPPSSTERMQKIRRKNEFSTVEKRKREWKKAEYTVHTVVNARGWQKNKWQSKWTKWIEKTVLRKFAAVKWCVMLFVCSYSVSLSLSFSHSQSVLFCVLLFRPMVEPCDVESLRQVRKWKFGKIKE